MHSKLFLCQQTSLQCVLTIALFSETFPQQKKVFVCTIKLTSSRNEKREQIARVVSVHPQTVLTTRHKEIKIKKKDLRYFLNGEFKSMTMVGSSSTALSTYKCWEHPFFHVHYGRAVDVVKWEVRRVVGWGGRGGGESNVLLYLARQQVNHPCVASHSPGQGYRRM